MSGLGPSQKGGERAEAEPLRWRGRRADEPVCHPPKLTKKRESSKVEGMFLRLMAYALLAYVIFMIVKFFSALNKGSRRPAPKQKISGGIMVKDETCNTYLPKEDAIKELYQGQEYYFCSEECRQKFLATKKPH